jgi:glutamine cyclotransferase
MISSRAMTVAWLRERLVGGVLCVCCAAGCSEPRASAEICGPPTLLHRATAAELGYRVVDEFPHDPSAFTQGLVIDGGELFESTGLEGASTLRRVTLETGDVEQQVALEDTLWGEGLAAWQGALIQLTWRAGRAFVYDRESFEEVDELAYSTQGWGLTDDGESLIMSDGSATLRFMDPGTFEERRRITVRDGGVPVSRLNELEHINGEIWANVFQTARIARIDPHSGRVVGWVALDGLVEEVGQSDSEEVLNGIAFDPEACRLFVTGKRWSTLFEIAIASSG